MTLRDRLRKIAEMSLDALSEDTEENVSCNHRAAVKGRRQIEAATVFALPWMICKNVLEFSQAFGAERIAQMIKNRTLTVWAIELEALIPDGAQIMPTPEQMCFLNAVLCGPEGADSPWKRAEIGHYAGAPVLLIYARSARAYGDPVFLSLNKQDLQ